jgi:hypothetical protein
VRDGLLGRVFPVYVAGQLFYKVVVGMIVVVLCWGCSLPVFIYMGLVIGRGYGLWLSPHRAEVVFLFALKTASPVLNRPVSTVIQWWTVRRKLVGTVL